MLHTGGPPLVRHFQSTAIHLKRDKSVLIKNQPEKIKRKKLTTTMMMMMMVMMIYDALHYSHHNNLIY